MLELSKKEKEILQKIDTLSNKKTFKELDELEQLAYFKLNKQLNSHHWNEFEQAKKRVDTDTAAKLFQKLLEMHHSKALKLFCEKDATPVSAPGLVAPKGNLSHGLCFHIGLGSPKDRKKAFAFLLAAAKETAFAHYILGFCYEKGMGTDKNEKKAALSYEETALQGLAAAQYRAGLCYQEGRGVEKNVQKAMHFIELAAKQEFAAAQYNLGIRYLKGIDVEKNVQKSVDFFELAAKQRFAAAQNKLGECYQYGIGVPTDEHEATRLYRLAAEQEHPDAQYNLGICYEKGIGVKKDEEEAVRFYQLATDQKHIAASYNLGLCHEEGRGVPKDENKAMHLYQFPADNKYAPACYKLGLYHEKYFKEHPSYLEGSHKAMNPYISAANKGYAPAFYKLAVFYEKGFAFKKDEVEALRLYRLATTHKDKQALQLLETSESPLARYALALMKKDQKIIIESILQVHTLNLAFYKKDILLIAEQLKDRGGILDFVNNLQHEAKKQKQDVNTVLINACLLLGNAEPNTIINSLITEIKSKIVMGEASNEQKNALLIRIRLKGYLSSPNRHLVNTVFVADIKNLLEDPSSGSSLDYVLKQYVEKWITPLTPKHFQSLQPQDRDLANAIKNDQLGQWLDQNEPSLADINNSLSMLKDCTF